MPARQPRPEQLEEFIEKKPEGSLYMLNLLKFRDRAIYEDGRETDLTGEEAYMIYGAAVSQLLKKYGGAASFSASVERLMLGEVEDLWDKIAIAMYPSRVAMLEMMQDPEMQEIGVHRAAGLAGQLNIETVDPNGTWSGDDGIS